MNGKCLSKGSLIFDVLGDMDELNSVMGWAKCAVEVTEVKEALNRIQDDVYRIMSIVGSEMQVPAGIRMIDESDVEFLEEWIERTEEEVGILTKFIRPGEREVSARLHVARSVARRAERKIVEHMDELKIPEIILQYSNRLSDLLFILAYKFDKLA